MGVTPLNTSDYTSGAGDLHGLVALFVGCFLSVADCRLLAVGCWLLAVARVQLRVFTSGPRCHPV